LADRFSARFERSREPPWTAGITNRRRLPSGRVHGLRRFNERTGTALNRVQVPTDIVFLVVFWRLRYKLSLGDLAEMFLIWGLVFTHEAVRDWEAKLQGSEDRAVGLDAVGGRPGERARLDAPLVP
jgi:hypothetical protein